MNIFSNNPKRERVVRLLKIRHCVLIAQGEARRYSGVEKDTYFVTMLVLELNGKGIIPNREN